MKLPAFSSLAFILLACVLTSPKLNAQQASITPDDKYKTDTTWPGVSFTIGKVIRLDAQNAVMIIKVSAETGAPPYTFLGSWPDGKDYTLDAKGKKIPAQPLPYSMMDSVGFDETTKIEYKPVPQQPTVGKPFYGFSQIITTIHSKEWLQMSLLFPIPVPPPNADGKVPEQKIDVTIAKAKRPIKGVVIPPMSVPTPPKT